jgi:hypothetical protein
VRTEYTLDCREGKLPARKVRVGRLALLVTCAICGMRSGEVDCSDLVQRQ